MITEKQVLAFSDALEAAVLERDSSMSVNLQFASGSLGSSYIVTIENATVRDVYFVSAETGQWIRQIEVSEYEKSSSRPQP